MPQTGQIQIIGGHFQDLEGNVLSQGYLLMQLSQDEQGTSPTPTVEVGAGVKIKVPLDINGDIQGTNNLLPPPDNTPFFIWPNDALNPAGSYYIVSAYDASGRLVWGPNVEQVLSAPNPFDVGAWVPNGVSTGAPVGSLLLQTNEVNNGSQSKLDLHAGTNVTLTDNGLGRVTIAASGGGGGGPVIYNDNAQQPISQNNHFALVVNQFSNGHSQCNLNGASQYSGASNYEVIVSPAINFFTGVQNTAVPFCARKIDGTQFWVAQAFVDVANVVIASNVLTITALNPFLNQYIVPGMQFYCVGLTGATFLNAQVLTIATVPDSSHFTANFTHANYSAGDFGGFASIGIAGTASYNALCVGKA